MKVTNEQLYLYVLISHSEGIVTFDTPSSSVTEGNAVDVCVTITAGAPAASALGSDLVVFLSTVPGEAGLYEILHYSVVEPKTFSNIYLSDPGDFFDGTYVVTFEMGTPFPLGDCVEIPTKPDNELEGDDDFNVLLVDTSPNDAALFGVPSALAVTIHDDIGMIATLQALTHH